MEKMKFKTFKMSLLNNATNTRFHGDILIKLNMRPDSVKQLLGIAEVTPRYEAATNKQRAVLAIITKSKYTRKISEKDHERDRTLSGFFDAVKAQRKHFNPEVREAAERVADIFKHYGGIEQRPYQEETELIADILREFERPDLAADLLLLGVKPWRDQLETVNNEFLELIHLRLTASAEMPTDRVSELRKTTDKLFRSILRQLEFLVTLKKITPALTELFADLNSVISYYKNLLAHHTQHSDDTEETEETEEAEGTTGSNDTNN